MHLLDKGRNIPEFGVTAHKCIYFLLTKVEQSIQRKDVDEAGSERFDLLLDAIM